MEPIDLLIIDDDPNIRRLLTELFSGKPDYRLLVASVALYARHRLEPTPFGVALDGRLLSAPLELGRDGRLEDHDAPVD